MCVIQITRTHSLSASCHGSWNAASSPASTTHRSSRNMPTSDTSEPPYLSKARWPEALCFLPPPLSLPCPTLLSSSIHQHGATCDYTKHSRNKAHALVWQASVDNRSASIHLFSLQLRLADHRIRPSHAHLAQHDTSPHSHQLDESFNEQNTRRDEQLLTPFQYLFLAECPHIAFIGHRVAQSPWGSGVMGFPACLVVKNSEHRLLPLFGR